jgi:ribosome-associated toxin RatA of RatAB toxin-antitoxin module
MAELTSSRLTIAATPKQVLDVIADLHAYPEWNGEIKSVEVLETEKDGRPRRARFTISSTGMTDEYTLDYDWADDGVSWVLAAPSTLQKSQVGSYRLVPTADGTEVRYDLKIDARIPMIGPMRRKIEKRIVDGALKELRKRVEMLR